MDFTSLNANQLLALFYCLSNIVCIIVFIFIYIRAHDGLTDHAAGKYFNYLIISHTLYFILDIIWALISFNIFQSPQLLLTVRIIKHCLISVASYLWFEYISLKINSDLITSKKRRYFITFILILSFAINILCCHLDRHSAHFELGYSLITNIIPIGFMLATIINAIYKVNNDSEDIKKSDLSYCIYIILFMIGGIVQILIPDLPILCYLTIFMIISMYSKLLRSLISIDPLTKLNNRNVLERYVENIKENNNTYVLMLDLDYFKQINDKFGHLEGDKALICVANELKSNMANMKDSFLGRYGGDEFIVILKNTELKDVVKFIDNVQNDIKNIKTNKDYTISISAGYAKMEDKDIFEQTLKKADLMLYEFKKR